MKKKFLSPLLFLLFSFSILTSCTDGSTEFLEEPFYVVATNGSFGKISPYGVIKMRDSHPKFKIIPDKGYKMDSLIVNGVDVKTSRGEEFMFSDISMKINTIRVTFRRNRR